MALTKFTRADNNIRALADKPDLSASALKTKFDQVGADIKEYINGTLTVEIDRDIYTKANINSLLDGKVDKVSGKGLSKNDFTDSYKTKLDGVESGAEVNVQPDWNESDNTKDDFIKNKPYIPTKTSDLTNDSGYITQHQDISGKADKATTYTKTETDNLLNDKADAEDVEAIENLIPGEASTQNKLADKGFVNSSIENVAAFYITKDAQGNPFSTKAELASATIFYSGGFVRVPTRNDYAVVLKDETKTITETGENPTTRYLYDNGWQYQYIVNNSGLTAAQWATVNSGMLSSDKTKLSGIESGAEVNVLEGVKVNGTDLSVSNKKVEIPNAQRGEFGLIKLGWADESGITLDSEGNYIKTVTAVNADIDEKTSKWKPITPYYLDYAVKSVAGTKVTSISASSTDLQYPSAKCVYDLIGNLEEILNDIDVGEGV